MEYIRLITILFITNVVISVFDLGIFYSNHAYAAEKVAGDSILSGSEVVTPRTFMLDRMTLVDAKKGFQNGEKMTLRIGMNELISQADLFLNKQAASVMDKKELPPSGDKHDFLSLAPYRWPDPSKKDGLPYIGRDGETNPEIYTIPDKRNLDEMIHMVTVLSAAYYFTNDYKYASKAQELLRVWFIDNSTKMNPNLRYAEMVRGKSNLYSGGIMAGRNLTDVIDSIGLIRQSPGWTDENKAGIRLWFVKYLNWLLNSTSGRLEGQKMNNHGTYYYVQVSDIALFVNKTNITKGIMKSFVEPPSISNFIAPERSIHVKIQPDGKQLFELQRTRSLDYSMFNLLGIYKMATIGKNVGVDFWNYKLGEEALLQKALDFLLPYITKEDKWPYQQVTHTNRQIAADLLCQGMLHYPNRDEIYSQAYDSIRANISYIDVDNLLPCTR